MRLEIVEDPKLLVPFWKEIVTLLDNIVSTVRAEYRPEVVVGVSRDGLIPALLISDLLARASLSGIHRNQS